MDMQSISEADIKIGKNILKMRSLADINQIQLGSMLNPPVSYQQVSKFERGHNRVSAIQLVYIAKALKCKVVDLLNGVEPIIDEGGGYVENITKQEGDLVKNYRQIRNPELQKLVRTMAHALIVETAMGMSQR